MDDGGRSCEVFRTGRCEVRGWREDVRNVPHGKVRGSRREGGRVKISAQGGARFWHRGRCQKDPSTVHPKGFGWLVGAALYTLKELGGW